MMPIKEQMDLLTQQDDLFRAMSGALICSGCENITNVRSDFSCVCGRMLCGECGHYCEVHKMDWLIEEGEK